VRLRRALFKKSVNYFGVDMKDANIFSKLVNFYCQRQACRTFTPYLVQTFGINKKITNIDQAYHIENMVIYDGLFEAAAPSLL